MTNRGTRRNPAGALAPMGALGIAMLVAAAFSLAPRPTFAAEPASASGDPTAVVNAMLAALKAEDPQAVLKLLCPIPEGDDLPRLLALIRGHQKYVGTSGEAWVPAFTRAEGDIACVVCVQVKANAPLPIAVFLVNQPGGWRIILGDYYYDPRLGLERKQIAAAMSLKDWLVENREEIQKQVAASLAKSLGTASATAPASSSGAKP
ncbi:MAG: hypothetical protein NTW19_18660 [Planctomycetota bacterium]|nr:hypothetical protein [Planctomycetota bacterium]